MNTEFLNKIFNSRDVSSHKGDFGHVTVIGGCSKYIGAPKFSYESSVKVFASLAESSMLVGCGTTTLALPDFLVNAIYPYVSYSSLYKLKSDGDNIVFNKIDMDELMRKTKVFAIGMGTGDSHINELVEYILDNGNQTIVLDADGLKKCKNLNFKNRVIITPHIGEMLFLLNENDPIRLLDNDYELVKKYALNHNCVVVLKDHISFITDGVDSYFNDIGNSKLAKGGSGDCLTGIIAGLIAYNNSLIDSARAGCYILGKTSEISKVNTFSHMPTDIIDEIPKVIDGILKEVSDESL